MCLHTGLIDLVTLPLAAQHGERKHYSTQGRGVDSFIILTCETRVCEHTHSRDHQGLTGVVPCDKVRKEKGESLFTIL